MSDSDKDALLERLRAAYHYYACPHHGKWHAELCILASRALAAADPEPHIPEQRSS